MMRMLFAACLALSTPFIHAQNPTECLEEVVESTDYFPDKVEPLSSEFWSITYANTYKILKNEIDDESYLLYQCGSEPPADQLDGRHQAVIPVPIPHGAALSQTTHIPHLEVLGVRPQISGYLGDPQYISSPCVNQMVADGDIVVVENTSDTTALDGLLLSSGEDLVSFVGSFNPVPLNNSVIVSAFKEKTNAGVYEWNKYFSTFFNLEGLANELYEEITSNYECIAENAARVADDSNDGKPVVLWAYYSSSYNGWDVAECPNYYCEYASICSATLLNSFDGSIDGFQGSKLMTMQEFVEFGKDATMWIFPSGDWDTVYADNKETLDQFASVGSKEVYDYQGSGSNAWFENRLVEFDVVAQDFCQVVGTQDPFHTRVWFRNVFDEEVGDPGDCVDAEAPLESRATDCTPVPPASAPTSSASMVSLTLMVETVILLATSIASMM